MRYFKPVPLEGTIDRTYFKLSDLQGTRLINLMDRLTGHGYRTHTHRLRPWKRP